MKFVKLKTETKMADLTGHVFSIETLKDPSLAAQAKAALTRANPHLQHLDKIPAGTLIFVSQVPGANLGDLPPAFPMGEHVATQLRQVLAGAKAAIERSAEMQTEKVKARAKLAESKEFKELASKHTTLKKRLPKMADEAKARLKEIAATKAAHQKAHATLEKNLDEFLKRFGYVTVGDARLGTDTQGIGEHLLREVRFEPTRVTKPTRKRKRR